MKVEGRPLQVSLPPGAADPMQLKIACSDCGCRYGVIGAAFFCPACGNSDAEVVFRQTLLGIRGSIGSLAKVRAAIPDPDTAENMVRMVIENGLQNTRHCISEVRRSTLPSAWGLNRVPNAIHSRASPGVARYGAPPLVSTTRTSCHLPKSLP